MVHFGEVCYGNLGKMTFISNTSCRDGQQLMKVQLPLDKHFG